LEEVPSPELTHSRRSSDGSFAFRDKSDAQTKS
jgi:hypothetical protein